MNGPGRDCRPPTFAAATESKIFQQHCARLDIQSRRIDELTLRLLNINDRLFGSVPQPEQAYDKCEAAQVVPMISVMHCGLNGLEIITDRLLQQVQRLEELA